MSKFTDRRDAFEAHVATFFTTLESRVRALFSRSVDAVTKAIEDNDDKIEGDTKQFFEDTADDAVKTAETVEGDWTTKLAAAVNIVATDFATKGIIVGKNVLVTLVVAAYTNFKASK